MPKIMLAIDSSEHAMRAWNFYNSELRKPDDEVILVHCIEIPYQQGYPLRAEVLEGILQKARKNAEGCEIKFKEIMESNQVKYQLISDFGSPGEFIVSQAKKEEPSLIVIGSRGMGKVRRTILGSVSDYVVHHAHCPVIVTRH